jgi:hypothetical protein
LASTAQVTQQPARVKLLAKKVHYALGYLKTEIEQARYPASSQSANDKPKLDDYPEWYSEEFVAAASTTAENVRLGNLTQPSQGASDAARNHDHNGSG